MTKVLSEKQMEFIIHSTKKINLAHGSVRCGKTVGSIVRVMQEVDRCPDSQIWFIGHTSTTVYNNIIRLILEAPKPGAPDPIGIFRPYCTWRGHTRTLTYKNKVINTIGAKDSGAIGVFHGQTMSIAYCDEMTLYPDNIIDMISTRLSNPHSILFATMNPASPSHKLKGWIDKATAGDPEYYALKFTLEDNPFVDDAFKMRLKHSLSGVFYKRNYLGEWCLAQGAIFDFFDRSTYVVAKPPRSAEYWIAGVDYGTNNAFSCLLIGVSTGQYTQDKPMMWIEKEYYWDSQKTERQKTASEYADDIQSFLAPYAVRCVYMDPSAAHFKLELGRRKIHVANTDNNVEEGIKKVTDDLKMGRLFICDGCVNLIREIEGYVWDPKKAARGLDEPLKENDHAVDAMRYAIYNHKPVNPMVANEYWKKQNEYNQQNNSFNIRPASDYGFR